MKPKDYLPREGDIVTIPAVVQFDYDPKTPDEQVHLKIDGYVRAVLPLADIADVLRRKWKPKDPVKSAAKPLDRGTVVAVDDRHVWVKLEPSGVFRTYVDLDLTDDIDPSDEASTDNPGVSLAVPVPRMPAALPRSSEVLSGCAVRAAIQQERSDDQEVKF